MEASADATGIPVPELENVKPQEPLTAPKDDFAPTFTQKPPRKPRTRKTPQAPETETPQATAPPTQGVSEGEKAFVGKAIALTLRAVFNALADKRGDHWRLTPSDEKAFQDTWGEAIAPFLGANSKWAPLVAAILTTGAVVMPRIQMDQQRVAALRQTGLTAQEIIRNESTSLDGR